MSLIEDINCHLFIKTQIVIQFRPPCDEVVFFDTNVFLEIPRSGLIVNLQKFRYNIFRLTYEYYQMPNNKSSTDLMTDVI